MFTYTAVTSAITYFGCRELLQNQMSKNEVMWKLQ